ncbi:VOC family protein [Streptomyces sp. NPDC053431]|uniref:VOC family protein n=1 Tax=Streptomyces sp. NPDC053431 TaxID=3365703 RepID=UPI0037D909C1
MRARVQEIVFDCAEPAVLVRFWAAVLGGAPVDRSPDWSYVDPPGFVRLAFQKVPEGKTVKNRVHLDVEVADPEGAAEQVLPLGARRSGGLVTDEQGSFQVMLDPEENEFCFVTG